MQRSDDADFKSFCRLIHSPIGLVLEICFPYINLNILEMKMDIEIQNKSKMTNKENKSIKQLLRN